MVPAEAWRRIRAATTSRIGLPFALPSSLRMRSFNRASVSSVLLLVSGEFLVLIGVAFLIAAPLAWWGMHQWLQEFAYRTPVRWWIFPLAGAAALFIAVLTISWQTARAATANPVDSLRAE